MSAPKKNGSASAGIKANGNDTKRNDTSSTIACDVHIPSMKLTVKHIEDQIPTKYFKRSLFWSLLYLCKDLLQVAVTAAVMWMWISPALDAMTHRATHFTESRSLAADSYVALGIRVVLAVVKSSAWMAFWAIQGLNGTAVWVLAHECGHQGFSPSEVINDTIGFVLHSFLLVPYYSWKITHGNHHKHTGHLSKDTVFIPDFRESHDPDHDFVREIPIVTLVQTVAILSLGWPAYLLFNVQSQTFNCRANHFEPSSPLFRPQDRHLILMSDLGVASMLAVLVMAAVKFGPAAVLYYYIGPYMVVNIWLVLITYLQHTDISLPHYVASEWTFTRGALATIDRDFGWLVNAWLHHIHDTHVVHHLFSKMPFYNCAHVTKHYIKGILGEELYRRDEKRRLLTALSESRRTCHYVIPSEGICLFYSKHKPIKYNVKEH